MKNPFKKKVIPTDSVPRSMAEINKAYSEELGRAGNSQYLVFVYSKELEQSNQKLLALNQEAKRRQDLDAASAAAAKKEAAAESKAAEVGA